MRYTTFRGKDLKGNWHEGDLVNVRDEDNNSTSPNIVTSYNLDSFDWHEVDTDTVGQYTGKDFNTPKKDKTIKCFEGDIAFSEDADNLDDNGDEIRNYGVCTWINDWSRFVWLNIDEYNYYIKDGELSEEVKYMGFDMSMDYMHYAGNIWDNSELLIEKQDEK